MPMSASAVVNRAELLAQIDGLDTELTRALAAADTLTYDRDGVIDEAHRKAEQIIADAQRERDRLVSDTEVHRIANDSSDGVLDEARAQSEALRRETDAYVDSKLANFEVSLTKILEAVSRGRSRLQGRSDLDELGAADLDDVAFPGDHT